MLNKLETDMERGKYGTEKGGRKDHCRSMIISFPDVSANQTIHYIPSMLDKDVFNVMHRSVA